MWSNEQRPDGRGAVDSDQGLLGLGLGRDMVVGDLHLQLL